MEPNIIVLVNKLRIWIAQVFKKTLPTMKKSFDDVQNFVFPLEALIRVYQKVPLSMINNEERKMAFDTAVAWTDTSITIIQAKNCQTLRSKESHNEASGVARGQSVSKASKKNSSAVHSYVFTNILFII